MKTCILNASHFTPDADARPVIQAALDENTRVEIGYVPFPLRLSRALILRSGQSLHVDTNTVLTDLPGCGGCLLRNESIVAGCLAPEEQLPRDHHMEVSGGIWAPAIDAECRFSKNDPHPAMRLFSQRGTLLGVLFFCNAEQIHIHDLTVRNATAYAVLVSCADHFTVEDVLFDKHRKDGIHVNGPASHGILRRLRGKCDDDFIALNAWDWHSSAVTYGPITDILAEDCEAEHDEMRLLPGKKLYDSGDIRDCPIARITFRRFGGLYSVKMYQQPYYLNALKGLDDRSLTAGLIEDVVFEDIEIPGNTNEAMSEVTLDAVWEMGADIQNVLWKNIRVGAALPDFTALNMTLANLGPKSSTFTGGNPDPAAWQELFEPDLICHGDGLTFENITFAGIPCTDDAVILKKVQLKPNPDYPNTKPRGGTGYGVVKNLVIR